MLVLKGNVGKSVVLQSLIESCQDAYAIVYGTESIGTLETLFVSSKHYGLEDLCNSIKQEIQNECKSRSMIIVYTNLPEAEIGCVKNLVEKLELEGKQLRKLIDEGDETLETVISVYKQIINCLKMLKIKLVEADKINLQYDIDSMIEDFQLACPEEVDTKTYDYYEEEENLNYNLREFYDFCDDNRVWIGL